MAIVETLTGIDVNGAEKEWRTIGGSYRSEISITRPNDSNNYAAMDAIGAATGSTAAKEFTSVGPSGEVIIIDSASLMIEAAALLTTEAAYWLFLYESLPPSAYGDNAAWDLPSGDRSVFLDKIDLGTPVDLVSTLFVKTDNLNKRVKLASGSTSLFAYLVTNAAYGAQTANRVYKVRLITRRGHGA